MDSFCYHIFMRIFSSAFLSLFLFLCAAERAQAQKYMDVRQYNNTYEINVHKPGDKQESKCQAVRLNKEWFITAAHCLLPVCDSECTIKAKLANTDEYEMEMTTTHNALSKAAYLHGKSKEDQVSYDIALIRFNPAKTSYIFKDKKNMRLIAKDDLFKKLNASQKAEFNQAIEGINFPVILSLKTQTPKLLNRALAVASVWDYNKEILSSEDYVFFSPKHNFLYTSNFGIRQGISGSGVITSSGELVAVVSAIAHTRRTLNTEGGTKIKDIDFSMFSTFDNSVLSFLKSHIPGLKVKQADFNYFAVVPDEYRALTQNMENMEL